MSRLGARPGLLPSMLDRLIDTDVNRAAPRSGYTIQQILHAVRRDLEDLLNSRQPVDPRIEEHAELADSIFNYGLPDITRKSASTPEQRAEICEVVASVIARFEPRLKNIRVTALEPKEGDVQTVRFEIRARLNVDPNPDVTFGTVLELSGHATIRAGEA
ncbi:MAG: type VI secretion system baseplate subunit TssE [Planctomycetota bacterium]